MLQTNSIVSAKNRSVLVAEVLSKIRSTFKTMSYSDIINVVSICASRLFGDKIEGQKFHDSIKMLTTISGMFQRNKFQQIAINSANMDKIKILQWNCRGLSNKILELLVFLKERDIDILCLSEVKSWQKENVTDDFFVVAETRASKSHGSIILAKRGTIIIEVKPEKFDRNGQGKIFEIIKACFEVPVIGHLWVTALYNSPGRDLNLSELFETEMKNVFTCGDFNAPHQELNCTYNTENGEKIIQTIETGKFKILNNGYHTYQSYQGECQNMLDLHFADQSVFIFFDTFYVSDDFGSDHSSTITTLNIMTQIKFDLKGKTNFKKFNQIVRQEYENSVLYPPVYPKAEELNQLNELLVQIIQFPLQKLYIQQKRFPIGHETTKFTREKKKKRRELKRTNEEQHKFLKKEINFLQREIKRSMKRSEKIK